MQGVGEYYRSVTGKYVLLLWMGFILTLMSNDSGRSFK